MIAVLAVLGWTLCAFGGVYAWTILPTCLLAAIAVWRAWPVAPVLDRGLARCLVAMMALPFLQHVTGTTIDPDATYLAALTWASVIAVFLVARTLPPAGLAGGVMTLAALFVAIVALTAGARDVYGWWHPLEWQDPSWVGSAPLGPFVNRTDAACWIVMALGVGVGQWLAVVEARQWWPALISLTRLGGLLVILGLSESRAGLLGACVALAMTAAAVSWTRGRRSRAVVTLTGLGVAVAGAGAWEAIQRVRETVGGDETWRWAADRVAMAPWLGTGLGAWPASTSLVSYTSDPGMPSCSFGDHLAAMGHAENQALQLLVEGGLALVVPVGLAGTILVRAAIQHFCAERRRGLCPVAWYRLGALTGLAGAAMVTLTESSLSRPANAMLAAVLLGVAVHEAPR